MDPPRGLRDGITKASDFDDWRIKWKLITWNIDLAIDYGKLVSPAVLIILRVSRIYVETVENIENVQILETVENIETVVNFETVET